MSEEKPFYEDLTFTLHEGVDKILDSKEVGKNITIGARVLRGDPEVRSVIAVPHAQRAIKVSFQESSIRKDFAGAPLRKSAAEKAAEKIGDTGSLILAKRIYESSLRKPSMVSSTIQQSSRELNIITKTDKRRTKSHAVNLGLLTNKTKIIERTTQQPIGLRDFLERFGIIPDLTTAYPQKIEAAIEAIDPSSKHFEEIDATLSVIKSWFRYHRAIHERLKRRAIHHRKEDKGGRTVCLEVHTANPDKPEGIEIIVGTRFGLSCDFDLSVKYCQMLAQAGIKVHDTLTELAFFAPEERLRQVAKKCPQSKKYIEAFKRYVEENAVDISYHTTPSDLKEKKLLHLAGTSILNLRRNAAEDVSAIQIEVPKDVIEKEERMTLIAKTTASFLDQVNSNHNNVKT